MPKTVRVHSTLSEEMHKKAKKDSFELLGKENVSGFIAILIRDYKKEKDE